MGVDTCGAEGTVEAVGVDAEVGVEVGGRIGVDPFVGVVSPPAVAVPRVPRDGD